MRSFCIYTLTILLLSSCVTKKRFIELSDKYDKLYKSNAELIAKNDDLLKDKNNIKEQLNTLQKEKENVDKEVASLHQKMEALQNKHTNLQNSYDLLSTKSSSELNAKAAENQKLLAALDQKEDKLFKEEAELRKLQAALDARSKRIEDLEALIASKEQALEQLKTAISNALVGFEGKGLTVEQRDGKIYVSMENKLLFGSGKWNVGIQGKKAVIELAKVLVENPDINVLIEGHTDNVPYKSGGVIQDNWDLSVKRATAIVRILQDHHVSANQITAAGRSEYNPVASNETSDGKAKNRRIEIVLSPNLDAISKLLNQ